MSHPPPEAPADAVPDGQPVAHADAIRARLQHLFRDSLQAGQVNPLLHIVLRYRAESPP